MAEAVRRLCIPVETRWVNIYPPCENCMPSHPWHTTSWKTRALADKNAKPGRLACISITFRYGDGLTAEQQRTMAW